MKILFLPRYDQSGASSRYRVYQYIPYFEANGIECHVQPLLESQYVNNLFKNKFSKALYLLIQYIKRLSSILWNDNFDFIFVEKEFFPFMYDLTWLFKLLNIRYIVDFDDAIFHNYDSTRSKNLVVKLLFKEKIRKIIKNAEFVICGSPYLTTYALHFNSNVVEIPTSINLKLYETRRISFKNPVFTVGWIGSKTTSIHLLSIQKSLLKFCLEYPCQVHLIGFDNSIYSKLDSRIPIKYIGWNEKTEVEEICKFSVGIMPLIDEPFERGKCGFKLIQYMACGLPTVSTPLEANVKIDRKTGNLFASNDEEWYKAFVEIYENYHLFQKIGAANIAVVENHYSIQSNLDTYIQLFNTLYVQNHQ